MTTNKYPRLCCGCYDFMDVRSFLHNHHRSSLHKIKVSGDNMDSVLTEVRKQMSDIGQISAYIMTIIVRDIGSLYTKDMRNLTLAIVNNRYDFDQRLEYIAEDPNAAANFVVSIYAYK